MLVVSSSVSINYREPIDVQTDINARYQFLNIHYIYHTIYLRDKIENIRKQEALRERKPPPRLVWKPWNNVLKRETV